MGSQRAKVWLERNHAVAMAVVIIAIGLFTLVINALMLWLRCYVAEQRPRAWTELRTCINDKFNAAGIVIAFPQRDVHMDFSDSLKVEVSTQPAS